MMNITISEEDFKRANEVLKHPLTEVGAKATCKALNNGVLVL